MAECGGFFQPLARLGCLTGLGSDYSRVKKETGVLGPLGQRLMHVILGFIQPACAGERPGQGVVRKNVAAFRHLLLRKTQRGLDRLATRRQVERKEPRITRSPFLPQFRFDRRRIAFPTAGAQCFRKGPLIFRQRIQLGYALQHFNGLDHSLGGEVHAATKQKRGRVIPLIIQGGLTALIRL
jgi:hypothetical protein